MAVSEGATFTEDFIRFQIEKAEPQFTAVNITAANPVISVSSRVYVTSLMLEELKEQIEAFLAEPDLECYWENDVPGIGGPPCVTMKFLPHNRQVLIEIYMELNDGGSFMEHNCRFYVATGRVQLAEFAEQLPDFLTGAPGRSLTLNQKATV